MQALKIERQEFSNNFSMLEVETKFLEVDPEAIAAAMEQLNAEKVYDGQIETRYYDNPAKTIRCQQKSLRSRFKVATGDVRLTSKRKISADVVRICEEHEVALGNGSAAVGRERYEELHMLLDAIGFAPYREYMKERTSFGIGSTRFELDKILTVGGEDVEIPYVLEIESTSADAVLHYASLLHLKKEEAQPISTRSLLKRYKVA